MWISRCLVRTVALGSLLAFFCFCRAVQSYRPANPDWHEAKCDIGHVWQKQTGSALLEIACGDFRQGPCQFEIYATNLGDDTLVMRTDLIAINGVHVPGRFRDEDDRIGYPIRVSLLPRSTRILICAGQWHTSEDKGVPIPKQFVTIPVPRPAASRDTIYDLENLVFILGNTQSVGVAR